MKDEAQLMASLEISKQKEEIAGYQAVQDLLFDPAHVAFAEGLARLAELTAYGISIAGKRAGEAWIAGDAPFGRMDFSRIYP